MLSRVGGMRKFLIKYGPLRGYPPSISVRRMGIVLVLALTMLTTSAKSVNINRATQKQLSSAPLKEVRPLASSEVVQRNIQAGVTDAYQLPLRAQQSTQIVVEQKGVDAVLKVRAADGSWDREVDNPNGLYGPETVCILARVAGVYSIEVSANIAVPAGSYELRVVGPQEATDADEIRVSAEKIFAEAQQLRGDKKYESAIQKYQEAVALWSKLDDKREQGYSLTNAGRSYKALGKPALALDLFANALVHLRGADDEPGQAFTLNEIGGVHRDFGNQQDAIRNYEDALKLRVEKIGDQYGQAQLYNNLGLAYSNIGYQPQAADNYEKASQLWRELQSRHNEMNTLVNAAKAHAEMGNLDVALSQAEAVRKYCDEELASKNSSLKRSATYLKPYALNDIGLV